MDILSNFLNYRKIKVLRIAILSHFILLPLLYPDLVYLLSQYLEALLQDNSASFPLELFLLYYASAWVPISIIIKRGKF